MRSQRPARQTNARDKRDRRPTYAEEFSTAVDIAADPVVAYMTPDEMQRSVDRLRGEMLKAAKDMEFMTAARLRDEIIKLEQRLEELRKTE